MTIGMTAGASLPTKEAIQMAVPITKARIHRSITLYKLPDPDDETLAGGAPMISQMSAGVKIGSAKKIDIKESLSNERWRELDAERNGETVEIVPGVATYTLTLTRVELYAEHAPVVFIGGDILLEQTSSFAVQIKESKPSGGKATFTLFTGCWLTENPVSYDIDSNGVVTRTMTIEAARKFVY